MKNKFFRTVVNALVFTALTFCAIGASIGEQATSTSEKSADKPNFEGKVVMLRIDRSTSMETKSDSLVIESPRILLIGGRYFVHGKPHVNTSDAEENWFADGEIGCAWETVKEYWVFSPEGYDKYEARIKKKHSDSE